MPHTPEPGTVYAVHSPLDQRWHAYQLVRAVPEKANKRSHIHIWEMQGAFARLEDIVLGKLKHAPAYTLAHDPAPRLPIKSYMGKIPAGHIPLGVLPLPGDEPPSSYCGDINCFPFVPEVAHVTDAADIEQAHYRSQETAPFDCAAFARRYPKMRVLSLFDSEIAHFAALAQLPELRSLTLIRCFPLDDELPDLSALPQLNFLWISGFPHAAGSALKAQAKKLPQLDYEITGLRKPEWYAANRDNPLAALADAEHIRATDAKAAAKIYKDSLKTALALPADGFQTALEQLAAQYAAAFNELNAQRGWIETEERETLCDAFHTLAQLAAETVGASADADALQAALDKARDW